MHRPATAGGNSGPPPPLSYFDKLNDWAESEGAGGLGSIMYEADAPKGPITRDLAPDRTEAIRATCRLSAGDAVFFVAGKARFAGSLHTRLAEELSRGAFRFCRIADFPMFELHEETGQVALAACWTRSAMADLRTRRRAEDRPHRDPAGE
jgi:aspartyl-tRNA synthetase